MTTPSLPPPSPFKSRFDGRVFRTQQERDRYDTVYHDGGGQALRDTELARPYPIQLVEEIARESARVPTFRGPNGGTFTSASEARQRLASQHGLHEPKLNMELVSDQPNPIAGSRLITARITAGGFPVPGVRLSVDGAVATSETNAGGIIKVLVPYLREARLAAHKQGYTPTESYRLPPR